MGLILDVVAWTPAPREIVKELWRLLAFCGRYGHQEVNAMLAWELPKLNGFAEALADLLREEKDTLPDGD